MPLHIGIVACSGEGAALCFRTICDEGPELMGAHRHPEVSLHTYPLAEYMEHIYRDDWQGVADLLLSSAAKLAAAGADFLICPDNTNHLRFDLVVERSPLPWLSIVEEVALEAKRRGHRRIGLLGTRFTMEGEFYPDVLRRHQIDHLVPPPAERDEVNRIIFDELVHGVFTSASKAVYREVIEGLQSRGCDAVILGCTEIPLLVTPEVSPLPTLDSTRLLARAALRKAVGEAEPPGSREGRHQSATAG